MERGTRNIALVNMTRIAKALGTSLSRLIAEMEKETRVVVAPFRTVLLAGESLFSQSAGSLAVFRAQLDPRLSDWSTSCRKPPQADLRLY